MKARTARTSKQVGGPEIVGFNENFRFEPASGIKVLYFLHAMQLVQAGTENLDTPNAFTYYVDPSDPTNGGVCPDPAWEVPANAVHTTLRDGLTKTMVDSDNRTTRGLFLRYGMGPENALAASIGMTNTALRQPSIGCGFLGAVRNDLSLADAGKLYEGVADGSLLDPADAAIFNQIMIGGAPTSSSNFGDIVRQEAAALGKSPADAASFIANVDYREKGGTYFFCLVERLHHLQDRHHGRGPDHAAVQERRDDRADGVRLRPVRERSRDPVRRQQRMRGRDECRVPAIDTLGTGAETFRSEIRAALATWMILKAGLTCAYAPGHGTGGRRPASRIRRTSTSAGRSGARLRSATPLTLDDDDLDELRGVGEHMPLSEVTDVYLPLSRLLNLSVAASRDLFAVTSKLPRPRRGAGSVHHRDRRQRRGGQEHDLACAPGAARALARPSARSTSSPPTASCSRTRCSTRAVSARGRDSPRATTCARSCGSSPI